MAKEAGQGSGSAVSADRLAKVFDCHERRIFELANKGIVVRAKERGRFELIPSIQGYIKHLEKVAGGREGDNTLSEVRTKLELEKTENFRLKNAQLRSELISREEMTEGWMRIVKAVRGAILTAPTKIRQRLPHLTAHDGEVVAKVLRQALEDVANAETKAPRRKAKPKKAKK